MARITISTGTAANDGTGDPLRTAFTSINANFTELYKATGGSTTATNQWLLANLPSIQYTAITRDSDNVVSSATVVWPDGSSGTFTRTAKNATFLTVDAYTVTHTASSHTLTQGAVTRDSFGNITSQPAITIT
jgi:hypothetical protein